MSSRTLLRRLSIAFCTLALGIVALFAAVRSSAFSSASYEWEFAAVGTYERLGKEEADAAARSVIDYIAGDARELHGEAFTAPERRHMADVRALFQGWRAVTHLALATMALLGILLAWMEPQRLRRIIAQVLLLAGGGILSLVAFVGAAVALGFDRAFTAFHGIFFEEGSWQFPDDARLIQLFPEQFFFDMAGQIMRDALLIGVSLCLVGFCFVASRGKQEC